MKVLFPILLVGVFGVLLCGVCHSAEPAPGDDPSAPVAGPEKTPGRTGRPARRLTLPQRMLLTVLMALVAVAALVMLLEERFIFFPDRRPVESWEPAGLGVENCFFGTADGLKLHAWWHPGNGPGDPSRRPVVLWCHGNAGNVSQRAGNLTMMAECGLAVFLFDYRGYGQSEGRPSEAGVYRDAEAAWDYLVNERGVRPGRIICFGRSLGAAVALHVALRRRVAGVIMEGAFESVPAMARLNPLFWPLSFLVRNRFDNMARIGRLQAPLLVMHGRRDRVVPFKQGRAVFDAAPEPKEFLAVEGAGHEDTYAGSGLYWKTLAAFCARCVAPALDGPGAAE